MNVKQQELFSRLENVVDNILKNPKMAVDVGVIFENFVASFEKLTDDLATTSLEDRQDLPNAGETTAQALDNLLGFIEKTGERFYNEHRRYQLLARIRKILREHLFDHFPAGSTDKSLVTAIINATNRTTAKNFHVKYLDIFRDSLAALREGRTDAETTALLEGRLLEIDDELQEKTLFGYHDPD